MSNVTGYAGNVWFHFDDGFRYYHYSTPDRRYHKYVLADAQDYIACFADGKLYVENADKYAQFRARHKPYPFDGGATFD